MSLVYFCLRKNVCEEENFRIFISHSDWSSLVADRSSGWYVTLAEDNNFVLNTDSIAKYLHSWCKQCGE